MTQHAGAYARVVTINRSKLRSVKTVDDSYVKGQFHGELGSFLKCN